MMICILYYFLPEFLDNFGSPFYLVTFNTPPGPHPPKKSPQGPWWHLGDVAVLMALRTQPVEACGWHHSKQT